MSKLQMLGARASRPHAKVAEAAKMTALPRKQLAPETSQFNAPSNRSAQVG
jgi:hypothetical protein